jgi:hypothetical protein
LVMNNPERKEQAAMPDEKDGFKVYVHTKHAFDGVVMVPVLKVTNGLELVEARMEHREPVPHLIVYRPAPPEDVHA